jgi:DNA polymerase-3 subunit gamma/tau
MLSLYRRHRPRTFDQVVGQEHIVRTVKNAIELDKVHHAYLFVGSRGTGKTSMAKLLACALNAEGGARVDFDPEAPGARAIMTGASLDVVEMDAASNNSVDDIRELRENVALAPMGGGRRVYILDEAHMLSNAAWNAFLKTLEEPPPHVVFVLATTEAHKVPATIVDRCHRFDFHRPSLEQIAGVLRRVAAEEGIEVPDAAIGMLARSSTGSFRDALGTLEQLVTYGGREVKLDDVLEVLGVADAELILETAESLVEHDPKAALLAVERLSASGRDLTQFMRDLAAHLRHLFVVQTLGEVPDSFAVTAEHTDRLGAQAARLAQGEVLRAIDLLAAAMSAVKDGSDPRIQLELALLKAVQPEADLSMQALLFRLEQLEARLGAGAGAQAPVAQPGGGEEPSAPNGAYGAAEAARPSASQPSAPPANAGAAPQTVTASQSAQPVTASQPPAASQPATVSQPAPASQPAAASQAAAARQAVTASQPAAAVAADPAAAPDLELERLRAVWQAVVADVCKKNGMVGAFLADARPSALEGGRLTLRFGPSCGFAKKKVESNRALVQDAVRSLTGAAVVVACELAEAEEAEDDGATLAAPPAVISEEELVERLKGEFGAREVFDDPDAEQES